jgi:hypothetical protein
MKKYPAPNSYQIKLANFSRKGGKIGIKLKT